MTDPFTKPVNWNFLAHTWEDENGSFWWAEGHVDPNRFVLSMITYMAVEIDADAATATLLDYGKTFKERIDNAEQLVNSVRYVWYRMKPGADEEMEPCKREDDGAMEFTRVAL